MDNTLQICCNINTSDALSNLGLTIYLDRQIIFNCDHVKESIKFSHDMPDDNSEHELSFEMHNKTNEHTVLDADGNIVKDARLIISNLSFDSIELNQIFFNLATYTHDFNGTAKSVEEKFYGEMGCNGIVNLKFTTPIYLWLLEHM